MASSLKQGIIDEITNKAEDFETNMSHFLEEYNDWADIYSVRPPSRFRNQNTRSSHRFSNPRLTEMFRAVNALATTEYRLLTSQDPFFEPVPMELGADRERLKIVESTIQTQLLLSEYKRHLLSALTSKILFGTVIVEEQYKIIGINDLRRFPVTTFTPRSMTNVFFDRNTFEIEDSDWLMTADVISNGKLRRLPNDSDIGIEWNKAEIEEAIKQQGMTNTLNSFVRNRLDRAGFHEDSNLTGVKELLTYHGKLDAIDDGEDYLVALLNREHMIRFHKNNSMHGKKPFRVAKWIDFELSVTGKGLGHLLARSHRSMDANRQKIQDLISMGTYNIWLKDRLANINANELKIRPQQVIETDNINGIKPIVPDLRGADAGLKLDEILKNEFRAASGATNTLQAIASEGGVTASEAVLSQNEALRAISVRAELAAEQLVRKHLQIMHSNNAQNVNEILNVNIDGDPVNVYPIDLQVDVDFRVKIVTDKDFKPQRIKTLLELLNILTSIRNQHPDKFNLDITPIAMELAGSLGINPNSIIKEVQSSARDQISLQGQQQIPSGIGQQQIPEGVVQTNIGQSLASP